MTAEISLHVLSGQGIAAFADADAVHPSLVPAPAPKTVRPAPVEGRWPAGALALSLLVAALALPARADAPAPTAAITLTDARGKLVQLAAPPQRFVSLRPSLAESVCALGACERIVGVDRYTTWPPALAHLPRLGGNLEPNIEGVLALRPDVVLISVASRAVQRLEALGLKVIALEPRTHAEVHDVLRTLASMLALPRGAEPIWARIEQGLAEAARTVPPQARGKRVYFEASRGPFAAGEKSFIGETLTRLGLVNVVPAALGPFPRLNPEYVVRADPDLLMGGVRSLGESREPYPGWTALRAMQAGRVCRFAGAEADLVIRPGPRMAEAAMAMARCVREVYP
jgi:iron complex transport system substrate-binding protein